MLMNTPTIFGDPAAGRELMRRIASRREGWWWRVFRKQVRIRKARLGGETVFSERLESPTNDQCARNI